MGRKLADPHSSPQLRHTKLETQTGHTSSVLGCSLAAAVPATPNPPRGMFVPPLILNPTPASSP
nr:unnamed protein product [Digitaria exilis]